MAQSGFPRELLEQTPTARLDYFKGYTIAHPALSGAFNEVWNALREPAGALLIFVFGPTGVGKTTLLAHIEKRLMEQALARMQENQGHLPVARLNAMAPSSRLFKWADFYTRALMRVSEPLIDYKINYHALTPIDNEKWQPRVNPHPR